MKIIDNFLSKSYHQELINLMTSAQFNWFYNEDISYKSKSKQIKSHLSEFGFSHIFWDENGMRDTSTSMLWKPGLLQIADAINADMIHRSRADMTVYTPTKFIHHPHVDYDFKNIATIFYVNESDGDTIFYKEKKLSKKLNIINKVSPKSNRLVIFDGGVLHTGSSPSKNKNRILINSNFKYQAN